MIDFDAKMSEAILYENFDSVEQIPSEYGDVRNKIYPDSRRNSCMAISLASVMRSTPCSKGVQ